ANAKTQSETVVEKVRNVSPIKINEFAGSFIELYNADAKEVDISGWSITEHATQQATFSTVKVPAGTKLASHGFYLLALSGSGLSVPAAQGDSTIYVRNVAGM